MEDIIKKISKYDFLTAILSGLCLVYLITRFTSYELIIDNIFFDLSFFYFLGLIIDRLGGVIVDIWFFKIVKKEIYYDYIYASKKDYKIVSFNTKNNMIRSFIVVIFLFLLIKAFDIFQVCISDITIVIFLFIILILFIYSYYKQTNYFKKRIQYYAKKRRK